MFLSDSKNSEDRINYTRKLKLQILSNSRTKLSVLEVPSEQIFYRKQPLGAPDLFLELYYNNPNDRALADYQVRDATMLR